MGTYFHSVTLDEEKCRGCTNCIKRCPTEAIRVRKSKARIINERCIDCGECIRICPYHAKKAITDPLEMIKNFKYKIVIPAPSLYGQFKSTFSRNSILTALKGQGFDEVYEVAKAAEIVSRATKKFINKDCQKFPLISSACPAVVRLIQVRFPNLIDNILKLESPMEVAAKIARDKAMKKENLAKEDVGVFFITPCAAKMTSVMAPYERESSSVSGVISIKDIYLGTLSNLMKTKPSEDLITAGFEGIRWANTGGESLALGTDSFLAVDGIHEVITILEEVENDRLEDVVFIEALACKGGCLGGPLTIENSYVARTRLKKHIDEAKEKSISNTDQEDENDNIDWTGNVKYKPVLKLDDDIEKAMKKLEDLQQIENGLPGLDCGACGAPSCRALAEDIVRGKASETDCLFKLRDRVRDLAIQMMELEAIMPPVMDKEPNSKVSDEEK
jgi:iron only hydrogenase large subunit-like protein